MTTIILVISGILLLTIGVLLYIRQQGIHIGSYTKTSPLFLSGEETIDFLGAKAQLSPEEKKTLEKLIAIGGTNRLHTALEGSEVGLKWVQNTRKAIYNSLTLDEEEKEYYEASLYELFRKISIARASLHPQLSHIKNIPSGQTLEIKMAKTPPVFGDFVSGSSNQLLIILPKDQFHILEQHYNPRAKLIASFWKEMDAGYAVKGEIEFLVEKKGSFQLGIKPLSPLKRTKVRSFPRKDAEIPVRFRLGELSVDQDSGGMSERFGAMTLGLLNDIGPKGGVILTHMAVPLDAVIKVEFPIMNTVAQAQGVVRSLRSYDNVFAISVEFTEISQKDTVAIYRFIYPDNPE